MACSAKISILRRPFLRWPDAWWASNGDIEVVVVPAIARIMRFGRPGGPNALWTNPQADLLPVGGWINWGGDKIWFWPQDEWPKNASGDGWPPPQDGFPATIEATADGLAWTLQSLPLFPGVQIQRSIHLPTRGTRIRLDTRVMATGPAPRPWGVTQIPCPNSVAVGALCGSGTWMAMSAPQTAAPERTQEGWRLQPDPILGSKFGFAAAQLSAATPAGRLTIATGDGNVDDEAAQVCFDRAAPENRPPDAERYAELEFAAPEGSAELAQWWSLE